MSENYNNFEWFRYEYIRDNELKKALHIIFEWKNEIICSDTKMEAFEWAREYIKTTFGKWESETAEEILRALLKEELASDISSN